MIILLYKNHDFKLFLIALTIQSSFDIIIITTSCCFLNNKFIIIRCVLNKMNKSVDFIKGEIYMENRRVQMTKRMLKDSLLELLENNTLENISVTDVCNHANVNRSTFYTYYEGTWQLMLEIENDVLNNLPVLQDEKVDYTGEYFINTLEKFFNYVKKEEKLFKILIIQRDNSNFNQKLVNIVMSKYPLTLNKPNILKAKYAYTYCVNGVVGILKEWINNNFPISTRDFSKIVIELSYKTTS